MRNLFVIFMFLLSAVCFGQYSDKELYDAYLSGDMSLWGKYVRTADFNRADLQEKQRILNISYGYIAYAVSEKAQDAEVLLALYKQRLDKMQGKMPESERLTYLSAYYAYAINYNKLKLISYGKNAISLSQKAVETDANDPLAVTLQGNILFYSPRMFGGDKAKALEYLHHAERLLQQQRRENTWNYRALQLTIAQCYEKTTGKPDAIKRCKAILKEEPRFAYIRDTYLPKLEGKQVKDDGEVAGKVSGMIFD